MTSTGSELTRILNEIGNSALLPVGSGVLGEAGTAGAEGTAGSGSSGAAGLSGLAGTAGKALAAASIADLFTSGSTWKGIGLCVAGGVLVLLGLMQLTGVKAPAVVPV